MNTRIQQGDVTVTLTGDIDAWVGRAVTAAGGEILRAIRADAEAVARGASGQWYEMVTKRTGLSGQIRVSETVDMGAGTVTVSVGSIDTRTAGKTRAPVPRVVSTPGPDSLILVEVTREEYFAESKLLRHKYPFIWRRNPKATPARRSLLKTLVVDPMHIAVTASMAELERRVAAAAERA